MAVHSLNYRRLRRTDSATFHQRCGIPHHDCSCQLHLYSTGVYRYTVQNTRLSMEMLQCYMTSAITRPRAAANVNSDLDGIVSCRDPTSPPISRFKISSKRHPDGPFYQISPLPFTNTFTCRSLSLIRVINPSSRTSFNFIRFVIIFFALSSRPSDNASITAWKSALT